MTHQLQKLSGLKQYTFIFVYISPIRAGLSRANVCLPSAEVSWTLARQLPWPCLASLMCLRNPLGQPCRAGSVPCVSHSPAGHPGHAVMMKAEQQVLLSSLLESHLHILLPNKQVNLTEPRAVTASSVRGVKIGTISAITLPQCGGIIIWKWYTQVTNYLAWIIFSMISVNLLSHVLRRKNRTNGESVYPAPFIFFFPFYLYKSLQEGPF